MAVSSGLLVLFLVAIPTAYAVQYTVGDSSGWNQGVDYTTWASGKTFTAGDTLLFTYGGSHSVDEVSKDDYDNCNTGNAIKSYNDGSTTITLSKAGAMYFICPALGHCGGGMKLAVTVAAASTTPGTTPATPSPPSSTPSPPAAGTPPTTPAPRTPTPSTPGNGGAAVVSNLVVGSLLVAGTVVALLG